MDEVLRASWVVLFMAGLLTQLVTPIKYHGRLPNQYAAIISSILFLNAIPVGFAAFGVKTGAILMVASIYFLLNAWVLGLWRFHALRTRRQVIRSATTLSLGLGAYAVLEMYGVLTQELVSAISLAMSLTIFLGIAYRLTSRHKVSRATAPESAPSVSLAVPARNETHALTQHLKSVIKSDYPKLEILVADDCSQDDTAQIIRSFAHDGVRFVQGEDPAESWIGKNHAYQLLSTEAVGEYVVFSGVDTRYEPHTISSLIGHMKRHKLEMVSILPRHERVELWSAILQPFRYITMLVGASKSNPPVLSTTWIVKRSALKRYGGFEAVENSIVPEQHFASKAAAKDAYQFIIADRALGLSTFKKPSSQRETAIRYIYPRLRKSVSNHVLLSGIAFLVIGWPGAQLVSALLGHWSLATALSIGSVVALVATYCLVIASSYQPRLVLSAPFYAPIGAVYFYAISIVSMISYELDAVIWKGRNVCYPVMMNDIHPKKKHRKS